MAHMGYKNFREPVVYVLNQELRKRNFKNQINTSEEPIYSGELPEYPCRLVRRGTDKKVVKIIYAEDTELQWEEDLIRNSEDKVYRIKTTYPDKTEKTIELFKGIDNKVNTIKEI